MHIYLAYYLQFGIYALRQLTAYKLYNFNFFWATEQKIESLRIEKEC